MLFCCRGILTFCGSFTIGRSSRIGDENWLGFAGAGLKSTHKLFCRKAPLKFDLRTKRMATRPDLPLPNLEMADFPLPDLEMTHLPA